MTAWDVLLDYVGTITSNFTDIANRTHWLFLLTALVGALISYRLYAAQPFTFRNFWAYALPKKSITHDSAKMDYFLFLMRPLWWAILVIPLLISIDFVAGWTAGGLGYLFGAVGATPEYFSVWQQVSYTILFMLAFDFGQYVSHYLAHRHWFLWEFHKIHHSTEVLNPLSALRFHPVDDLMVATIVSMTTGFIKGAFLWLWGDAPQVWQIAGVDVGLFLFYFAAYNLRHSQVWLAYPQWLSRIVQSPCMHQIHHSTARHHWDKNLGFTFSFWDQMFGTQYIPKERETLEYGLGGGQDAPYQSPLKVYTLPFKNIIEQLLSGKPAPEMAMVKDLRALKARKKAARVQKQLRAPKENEGV